MGLEFEVVRTGVVTTHLRRPDTFRRRKGKNKATANLRSLFFSRRFVGDCQINLALTMFVEEHAREIAERNLYRNFVVHCCNLFEFGVIGPAFVFAAVNRMQLKLRELGLRVATAERAAAQWKDWETRRPPRPSAKSPSFSGLFNKSKTAAAAAAADKKPDL